MPDYELCLAEVRSRTDGGDTSDSAADFRACLYAIGRGASEAEVEAWLPEVSETAAAKGRDYVRRTVAAAARTAAR